MLAGTDCGSDDVRTPRRFISGVTSTPPDTTDDAPMDTLPLPPALSNDEFRPVPVSVTELMPSGSALPIARRGIVPYGRPALTALAKPPPTTPPPTPPPRPPAANTPPPRELGCSDL